MSDVVDVSDKMIDLRIRFYKDNRIHGLKRYPMRVHFICFHLLYNCYGITYNKTLLEQHGWEAVTSFTGLKNAGSQSKKKQGYVMYGTDRFSIRVLPSSIYVILLRMRDSLVPCLESSGRKITCQERQMSAGDTEGI